MTVLCLPETDIPQEEGVLPEKVKVAIVIDDMGLSPAAAARILRLSPPISLSYLPYAPQVGLQAKEAKKAGHEVLLHMPMEPLGGAYPGPEALMVGLDDEELRRRIVANLKAFEDYDGLNNHMGSKFTLDNNKMKLFFKVLDEVKGRTVFFLDSRTSYQTVAQEEALLAGFKSAMRDVFLDDKIEETAVLGELARLEDVARKKGVAIAIGHPHPVTIKALEEWLPAAEARGFEVVPVGQLVHQP